MSNSKLPPPILKPFQIHFQKCITLGVYLLNWRRARQLCEGWQNFHSKSQFVHFAWQWGRRWGSEGRPSWNPSFRSAPPSRISRLKVACPHPLAHTLTTSLRLRRRKASSVMEKLVEFLWSMVLSWKYHGRHGKSYFWTEFVLKMAEWNSVSTAHGSNGLQGSNWLQGYILQYSMLQH